MGVVVPDASEAVIPLTIVGANDARADLQVVIDTGFTGHITLPPDEVRHLGLTSLGSRYVTLGDGSMAPLDVYRATVLWNGDRREARVFASEGGPLLGMALLYGSRLEMDVVDGGEVKILPRA